MKRRKPVREAMFAGGLALALLSGACGGEKCPEGFPSPLAEEPVLPASFPKPDGVTYVTQRDAGPSLVVDGRYSGTLEEGFEAYGAALEERGYVIVKDEREARDAEVAFEGDGVSGQVALRTICDTEQNLSIVVRPAIGA